MHLVPYIILIIHTYDALYEVYLSGNLSKKYNTFINMIFFMISIYNLTTCNRIPVCVVYLSCYHFRLHEAMTVNLHVMSHYEINPVTC